MNERNAGSAVMEKFDGIAKNYDSQRRSLIPCYDDFYATIVWLADTAASRPRILDVGAGTGLLTRRLWEKYPHADFTLVDLSEEMLKVAKGRFMGHDSFEYIQADYTGYDFNGPYDIIASSLSIHHLADGEKERLYRKIYGLLDHGGVFINADQVIGPTPYGDKEYQRRWKEAIDRSGLTELEKEGAFERMKMDRPATLEDNLTWLKGCGFIDVDVYYKYFNFAVVFGRKR